MLKIKKHRLSLLWLMASVVFNPANATGMPVFDAANLGQLLQQLNAMHAQYDLLDQTYLNAIAQLEQAQRIANDLEGNYGIGDWHNSAQDLQNLKWSPSSWDDALRGLSGGNPDRYQELVSSYQDTHPSLSRDEYRHGGSEERWEDYQKNVAVNQAASVQASYAFNEINDRLEQVHELTKNIESTENLKASQDLNARLTAELAFINLEILKMQAVQNQQLVQQNAHLIASESQSAQFNRLPDE